VDHLYSCNKKVPEESVNSPTVVNESQVAGTVDVIPVIPPIVLESAKTVDVVPAASPEDEGQQQDVETVESQSNIETEERVEQPRRYPVRERKPPQHLEDFVK